MAGTLASLLTDFSSPIAGEASGIGLLRTVKVPPDTVLEPQQPVIDRQAELIRSAEERVRVAERETARKELEDAIAAEKARHIEDMNSQRTIWVEQQALQMSAQILSAVERIEENLSERIANILRPFVSEAFRQQTLIELKDVLASLLSDRDAGLLTISGPGDLLSAIKNNLGRYESSIEFSPSEHVEITVVTQDTLIRTQLNSWSVRLAQALES
jgi:hypothetical protein